MPTLNQDEAEAQEEKERIMQEIYRELHKIQELETGIHNNLYIHSPEDLNDPGVKHVADCESLQTVLIENQAECSGSGKENTEKDVLKELDIEKTCLEFDLERTVKLIEQNEANILRANANMGNLITIVDKSKNEENKNLIMDNVLSNVRKRFKEEKKDLRKLIDTLFPDNVPFQDLFASVVDHYFKEGPDKYLSLDPEDGIAEMIETLRQTTLFEANPHDPLQIRLADLL